MKLFRVPDLLPDDMPREKRLELIRNIGGKAQEEFEDQEEFEQMSAR